MLKRLSLLFTLLILVSLLNSGCTQSNSSVNYGVTMRPLSDSSSSSSLQPSKLGLQALAQNNGPDFGSDQRDDGVAVTSNIESSLTSTVYCEDSSETNCPCSASNVNLEGIFIKPDYISVSSTDSAEVAREKFATYTRLIRDGEYQGGDRDFGEDDVIGIDIEYLDEYVRMSDIYIFDQEDGGKFPFIEGVAEDIFISSENNTHSVSFDFPIGSEAGTPNVSTTGCWMKIVLDFNNE